MCLLLQMALVCVLTAVGVCVIGYILLHALLLEMRNVLQIFPNPIPAQRHLQQPVDYHAVIVG